MSEKNKKIELLLSKLRSPLHLDFICNNILKCNKLECLDILNELVEKNIIEEKNKTYKLK